MSALPLRVRLFVALSGAAILGALTTGLYAVVVDPVAIGFAARAESVAPKALVLAAVLLPMLGLGALALGRTLARPVEDVADAAVRAAQGDGLVPTARMGIEARRIVLALCSMRREIDRRGGGDATLRDQWHELRNALGAVRASLELLESGDLSPADRARFVAHAAHAAEELDARLEALVTLARMRTVAMQPTDRVWIPGLVRDEVARATPLAEARRVRLSARATERGLGARAVMGDRVALGRALANLIQNACAATRGGTIDVAYGSSPRGDVVVEVVNEPASIPSDARPLLFARTPSRTGPRRAGGTGLGLAIARATVEAHGGRLAFVEWGPPRVRVRIELPG